jgi:hypothetical protein
MEQESNEQLPAFGMRVKEETPAKIVLEWWEQKSVHSSNFPGGVISFLKGIFSTHQADTIEKELDTENVTPTETITLDFASQRATRIKKSQSGSLQQTDLDLKEVSQVRIQMEELGHHFRLYLDSPRSEPFQVSIAFINSSYSPDTLREHGKKIGRVLDKPVIQQHTDLGHLISEETIQT